MPMFTVYDEVGVLVTVFFKRVICLAEMSASDLKLPQLS